MKGNPVLQLRGGHDSVKACKASPPPPPHPLSGFLQQQFFPRYWPHLHSTLCKMPFMLVSASYMMGRGWFDNPRGVLLSRERFLYNDVILKSCCYSVGRSSSTREKRCSIRSEQSTAVYSTFFLYSSMNSSLQF